jgi:hypothetical protein
VDLVRCANVHVPIELGLGVHDESTALQRPVTVKAKIAGTSFCFHLHIELDVSVCCLSMLPSCRGQVDAVFEMQPTAMPVNASAATAIRSNNVEGSDYG